MGLVVITFGHSGHNYKVLTQREADLSYLYMIEVLLPRRGGFYGFGYIWIKNKQTVLSLFYISSICVVRSHLSDIVGVHGLDNPRLSLKLLVFGALLEPFLKLVCTSLLLQTRIYLRR